MTGPCRLRSDKALSPTISKQTFNVHKGLCTSWWLPWT